MLDFFVKNVPWFSDILFDQLDDEEIAALRLTNRSLQNSITDYFDKLAIPYRTVFHFFLNNQQFFIDQKHALAAQMFEYIKEKEQEGFSYEFIQNDIIPREQGRIKNLVRHCWLQYYDTYMESTSIHPAMLYKLADKDDGIISEADLDYFDQGEDHYATRRIYKAYEIHTWPQNATWLLALIHKRKSFVIFSTINEENLHRTLDPDIYSAFAKEIASVIKIGYQAGIHSGFLDRIVLCPMSGKNYHPDLSQLNPKGDEIEHGINKVIDSVKSVVSALKLSDSHVRILYTLDGANDTQSNMTNTDSTDETLRTSSTESSSHYSGSFFSSSSDSEPDCPSDCENGELVMTLNNT